MTLEEAIRHCEEIAESYRALEEESELQGCDNNALKCAKCAAEHRQLAEWLKELKQLREQTRWIPVSERLPEAEYGESESVLVCFENETQDVLYFDGSNWCYPTGETYISVNHKNNWHNKVIAWMPLLKSCKAESEEA